MKCKLCGKKGTISSLVENIIELAENEGWEREFICPSCLPEYESKLNSVKQKLTQWAELITKRHAE